MIELALLSYKEEAGTSLDPLSINKAKAAYIRRMKNYYLPLERMLILEFNPEYNTLKISYSNAGYKRSLEAITNSALKKSKVTSRTLRVPSTRLPCGSL